MKIGTMLLNEGVISYPQLSDALAVQKQEPQRKIGEILLSLDYIDAGQFGRVLRDQLKQDGVL